MTSRIKPNPITVKPNHYGHNVHCPQNSLILGKTNYKKFNHILPGDWSDNLSSQVNSILLLFLNQTF